MKTGDLLEIKDVSKFFHGSAGAKYHVLEKINLSIEKPTNVGILAGIISPLDSGKSTLMKIISAIEKPSSGEVLIEEKIYDKPDGRVIYIPEKPSSFPWMNVKQNIEFAIHVSKNLVEKEKIKIDEIISVVGLTGYEDHFPHEKSLGFRLRISIARALAAGAKIVLLDDPFKNLHGETKNEIIRLIKSLRENYNRVLLFSTSNINEAVSISDRIYLLSHRPGRIIKEIEIDCTKRDEQSEYIASVKNDIEKLFQNHDKIPSFA